MIKISYKQQQIWSKIILPWNVNLSNVVSYFSFVWSYNWSMNKGVKSENDVFFIRPDTL